MKKMSKVTLDDILQLLSSLEPEKYILIVQPKNHSRSLDYLKEKLGLASLAEADRAVFFRTTFCSLKDAREFVAEYLTDDYHWQQLALGIYHNAELIWEGSKDEKERTTSTM